MADTVGKPLFDGRAKFSELLVKKIELITENLETGNPTVAFTALRNYDYLTRPNNSRKDEVSKLFDEANDKIKGALISNIDSELICKRYCDIILPILIDGTNQLLCPTTGSEDSKLTEDDFFK